MYLLQYYKQNKQNGYKLLNKYYNLTERKKCKKFNLWNLPSWKLICLNQNLVCLKLFKFFTQNLKCTRYIK